MKKILTGELDEFGALKELFKQAVFVLLFLILIACFFGDKINVKKVNIPDSVAFAGNLARF